MVLRLLAAAELTIDGQPYKPDPAPMLAIFEWVDTAGTSWPRATSTCPGA